MNKGLSDELKSAFPDIVPANRPLASDLQIKDPNWVSGFTSGEGCFWVRLNNNPAKKKVQVQLEFQITQDSRDKELINSFLSYLDCGRIRVRKYKVLKNDTCLDFIVTKFCDIDKNIISFFRKYPILGVKALDFEDWCIAAEIVKSKAHLSIEGLERIRQIKAGMNKGRDI